MAGDPNDLDFVLSCGCSGDVDDAGDMRVRPCSEAHADALVMQVISLGLGDRIEFRYVEG